MRQLTVCCAWCGKVWDGREYVMNDVADGTELSHGICPECLEKERAKLTTYLKARRVERAVRAYASAQAAIVAEQEWGA